MAMKRCSNGHFYDSNKYQQCPYCGISNLDASKTMPIVKEAPNEKNGAGLPGTTIPQTVPSSPQQRFTPTQADPGKTIGIMKKSKGIDPVVGWLVCTDGPSKGQDYKIKSERNFIGRGQNMDIALTDDNSVSRENHAIVSFNPKNQTFRVVPGDGHGLVYLNDEEVFTATELKARDVIELGETKLLFIPLCGGDFSW